MPQQVKHTCAAVRGGGAASAGDVTIAVHEGFPALTETRLLGAGVGTRHWEVDTACWRRGTDISRSHVFIRFHDSEQVFTEFSVFIAVCSSCSRSRRQTANFLLCHDTERGSGQRTWCGASAAGFVAEPGHEALITLAPPQLLDTCVLRGWRNIRAACTHIMRWLIKINCALRAASQPL